MKRARSKSRERRKKSPSPKPKVSKKNNHHEDFLATLHSLTLKEHPSEKLKLVNEDVGFNPLSFKNVFFPTYAFFHMNLFKIPRPFVGMLCIILWYIDYYPIICLPLSILLLTSWLLCDFQCKVSFLYKFGKVGPGVYCKMTNFSKALLESSELFKYPYYHNATQYLWNGELQTIIPFLLYSFAPIKYTRVWVPVKEAFGPSNKRRKEPSKSHEAVALDISFPPGGFDPSKSVYVILHGLNGGSSEEYVLDFVHLANSKGITVCIMIARGLMKTPISGDSIFNGARIDDIQETAKILRQCVGPNTKIGGVGFSMGGIILGNYMASSGKDCALDAGISLGGSIDCTANHGFYESVELWQQILCARLKESVIAPSAAKIVKRGITIKTIDNCRSIEDLDSSVMAPYFGWEGLDDYHDDMSAGPRGKIDRLSKPLLYLNALNDPICGADSFHKFVKDVNTMNENLYVIMSVHGGHVGWPLGFIPTNSKFYFMSNSSLEFCENVFILQEKGL